MRVPLLAVVTTLALAGTVSGPAYADDVELSGQTCGMDTTNEPTGVVYQNPFEQFGTMTAGGVSSVDHTDDPSAGSSHLTAASLAVHCWVQVNVPDLTGPQGWWPFGTCDAYGHAEAAGACAISYVAEPGDDVYLCTQVESSHAGTTQVYRYDAAPGTPGVQCALGTITPTVLGSWTVRVPPSLI